VRPDLGHEHVGDAAAEAELELRGVGRRGQRQVLLRRARSYFVEPARRAALEAALDRAQRVEGDVRALEAAPPRVRRRARGAGGRRRCGEGAVQGPPRRVDAFRRRRPPLRPLRPAARTLDADAARQQRGDDHDSQAAHRFGLASPNFTTVVGLVIEAEPSETHHN